MAWRIGGGRVRLSSLRTGGGGTGGRRLASHSCLIKEVGLVVNRTARLSRFSCPLFDVDTPQNHGSDELIFDLSSVFEQWTNLRPFMRRNLSLISSFGHSSPFRAAKRRKATEMRNRSLPL